MFKKGREKKGCYRFLRGKKRKIRRRVIIQWGSPAGEKN